MQREAVLFWETPLPFLEEEEEEEVAPLTTQEGQGEVELVAGINLR